MERLWLERPWLETMTFLPMTFLYWNLVKLGLATISEGPAKVVLLVHPSNSCQVCKCLTGAWLPTAVRERVTHLQIVRQIRMLSTWKNPEGGLFLYILEGRRVAHPHNLTKSMAEVLRRWNAHSPSRGSMGGPTSTQYYTTGQKYESSIPTFQNPMGLERWLITCHNNSQRKLSQPCSPPRAKVGRLSISVVAERALANIL